MRGPADSRRAGLPRDTLSFWNEPGAHGHKERQRCGGTIRGEVAQPLIECVPNFSEGRDAQIVQAIEKAIRSVPGLILLRSEMDPDHNRSVITFAGPPDAVAEGASEGIAMAVERIDL